MARAMLVRARAIVRARLASAGGDDRGAILILALVFMIVTSLAVYTLSTWAGNSLIQAESFKSGSELTYATGAAVQMEAQSLRYAFQSTTSGFESCTPGSGTSITLDSQSVTVYCSIVDQANSAASRVITFDACESTSTETECESNPYLQATYTYDDYSASDEDGCTSTSDEVTCGSGMSITGWEVV